MPDLTTVWFVAIAVLWTGYLALEGFDFGVGMLLPVLGRDPDPAVAERRKRVLLTTIGPVWDGNEVWLITAGGAMFAAFPHWYATMFSGFYLPLLLILVALIVRNLGFEYRHKRPDATWKRRWDIAIVTGSLLPALLWGIALTNLVRGVPIDADGEFAGSLLTLLHPTALLGGLAFVAVFLTHGAVFVALKTDGPIRADARRVASRSGGAAAVLAVSLLVVLGVERGGPASWVASAVAATALTVAIVANGRSREGLAFTGTFVAVAGTVAAFFLLLFPDVMPSTLDPAWSLTVTSAASTDYTLRIMSVVALVFLPLVLAYQAWSYWVFRKRITVAHIPA